MASVVTEHMLLLVPMMMVIMIFPMVAGFVVNNYNNEQRVLAVEQASSKVAGAIQQIYLVASENNVKDCSVTLTNPIPTNLEGQQYIFTGTQEGDTMTLHVGLPGLNLYYDHKLTLGENAVWDPTTMLDSNSPTASIIARKQAGTIYLGFG